MKSRFYRGFEIRDKIIEELRNSGIMNYKKFEDLPCWKKARELCQAISGLINQGEFRKDYSLRDQIWRAAGSIMDNTCPVK